MTKPIGCPPAPGPLEKYAAGFDDLFTHVAQRRGFREYLAGLLAPRDRNKTLTALGRGEPVTGSQLPGGQRAAVLLFGSVLGAGAGERPPPGAPPGRAGDAPAPRGGG